MKVLFITNIPTPYKTEFFRSLGKCCDLTVTYEGLRSTERNPKWNGESEGEYLEVVLKSVRTGPDSFFSFDILKILKKKWDRIIVGCYATPTSMLAIEYMRLHKIPFFIEADGGFIKQESRFKYRLKRHFISSATGWYSSAKETTKYLVHYGADAAKCKWYPLTSLSEEDFRQAEDLQKLDKVGLRRELGMEEDYILLTVGRFSYQGGYGKGYDVLLRSATKLDSSIGIYIVGDEPTEEFRRWKEENALTHVHFIGFHEKKSLYRYYAAADAFAFMTRADVWGMVIGEAMLFGLPIITTDKCIAGTELIESHKNGRIIPWNENNDAEKMAGELAETVTQIKDTPQIGATYGELCKLKIQDYTVENMARCHVE